MASPDLRTAESHVAAACAVVLRTTQGLNMSAAPTSRSAVRTWALGRCLKRGQATFDSRWYSHPDWQATVVGRETGRARRVVIGFPGLDV